MHSADALIVMRASAMKKNSPPGETKERLPAFNGLTTYRRIGTNDGAKRPTGRDRSCVRRSFKNKTYASLKPLTCSILICLTIVLLPDSPAPETGGENRQIVNSSLAFPRRLREICARDDTRVRYIYISSSAKSRFAIRDDYRSSAR